MVAVGVLYTVKEGCAAEAEECLRRLAEETRKEPGCILYVAHRSVDDPLQFFIYEQYRSPADLDAHRATAHFQRYARNGLQQLAANRVGGAFRPL
jgi:quinol monooxygenase YgiN